MKVARVEFGVPDGFVDVPQLGDGELVGAKGCRERRVFEFRPGAFDCVGDDAVMVEREPFGGVDQMAQRRLALVRA